MTSASAPSSNLSDLLHSYQPLTVEQERTAPPETLFFHNLRFALRLAGVDDGPGLDERRAAAMRALWKAAQGYRAQAGPSRFIHYARFAIRHDVAEARADAFPGLRIPARARAALRRLRDGLPLTSTQLKNVSGLVPVYLDAHAPAMEEASSLGETICDTAPGPLENLLSCDDSAMVRRWMGKSLNERESLVLTRVFGLDGEDPDNMRQLAKKLGVSYQRVEQIEKKALRKLREFKRLKDAW
jgi:RNA polymerase sigma factor (sigma-70 family)